MKTAHDVILEWLNAPPVDDPKNPGFMEVSADALIKWLDYNGFEIKSTATPFTKSKRATKSGGASPDVGADGSPPAPAPTRTPPDYR